MPSKLYHITRRRKNALKVILKGTYSDNDRALKEREIAETLRHRIANGNHSSAWYKKQARKKPVIEETEAA